MVFVVLCPGAPRGSNGSDLFLSVPEDGATA